MTPQQQQIVSHIEAEPGLSAKEIARLINSTQSTVQCQIHRLVKSGQASFVTGYVLRKAS